MIFKQNTNKLHRKGSNVIMLQEFYGARLKSYLLPLLPLSRGQIQIQSGGVSLSLKMQWLLGF